MKKTFSIIALATTYLTTPVVFAQSNGTGTQTWASFFQSWWNQLWNNWNTWSSGGGQSGGGHSVPELDGSTGPLAIALITVVVGIGLERVRRKNRQGQPDA